MTKKLFAAWALAGLLLFSFAGHAAAHENTYSQRSQKIDRTMPVDPQATVTLCVAQGTLRVRGWDKNEIRVQSLDAARIDFRRIDRIKDASRPANRVDVMVFDRTTVTNPTPRLDCQAIASVDMDVPAGATVQVQTRDGDIIIAGIAGAYAGSQNGDIDIERVTKQVEVGSLGGSIFLKDSSGRVDLSSVGGVIKVTNLQPATDEDTVEVGTVSGDIQLNRVSNLKVNVKTVNGTVTMMGPLAKSGWYGFSNMTGDLILAMPANASFRLNATISEKHDIVSDFALTYLTEAPPAPPAKPGKPAAASKPPDKKPLPRTGPIVSPIRVERPIGSAPYVLRRVTAVCGTGDATITIASFGGSVRLKKL